MGIGVLLLGFYQGFATAATNILFGNIFGVSGSQLLASFAARNIKASVFISSISFAIYSPPAWSAKPPGPSAAPSPR